VNILNLIYISLKEQCYLLLIRIIFKKNIEMITKSLGKMLFMNRKSSVYRNMIEQLMMNVSDIFDKPVMDVDVDEAMELIGKTLGASRAYIFMLKSNGSVEKKKIENLHEWCADGIEPDCNIMLDVYSTELPWWMNKLAYKQTINLNDVKNLPMEAEVEKSIFEAQNVSSIMAAPLFNIRESLFGFIAMDSLNGKMNWGPYDEKLLNLMANNFMEYLQKRKTEIEMRRATRILNCTWKKKKK